MSIDEEGFLSPELSEWIVNHRKENAEWIDYAKKLNSNSTAPTPDYERHL